MDNNFYSKDISGKKIFFYKYEYTYDQLIKTNNSLIRFGDGELRIIGHYKTAVYYQDYNSELANKLLNIFKNMNTMKETIMCIANLSSKSWYHNIIFSNLDVAQPFHDAQLTRVGNMGPTLEIILADKKICYVGSMFGETIDNKIISIEEFNELKQLYLDKNNKFIDCLDRVLKLIDWNSVSTMIVNDTITTLKNILNIDNSKGNKIYKYIHDYCEKYKVLNMRILDSIHSIPSKNTLNKTYKYVKSIDYIECKFRNSYDDYDLILEKCKKIDTDTIFIMSCGPTGKVLAYDLINIGYKVLDLGHYNRYV